MISLESMDGFSFSYGEHTFLVPPPSGVSLKIHIWTPIGQPITNLHVVRSELRNRFSFSTSGTSYFVEERGVECVAQAGWTRKTGGTFHLPFIRDAWFHRAVKAFAPPLIWRYPYRSVPLCWMAHHVNLVFSWYSLYVIIYPFVQRELRIAKWEIKRRMIHLADVRPKRNRNNQTWKKKNKKR